MQYILSRQFEKSFKKLPKPVKSRVIITLEKFIKNPEDPALKKYALSGKWKNHFSINVASDVRAIYVCVEEEVVYFVALGSHSELYG